MKKATTSALSKEFKTLPIVVCIWCSFFVVGCAATNNVKIGSATIQLTRDKVPGNYSNGITVAQTIYRLLQIYRSKHTGAYPSSMFQVYDDIESDPQLYGFRNAKEAGAAVVNVDNRYADNPLMKRYPSRISSNIYLGNRADGRKIGEIKQAGTLDVLAYSSIYFHRNRWKTPNGKQLENPIGGYLVLWDDGKVEQIDYDQIIYTPSVNGFTSAFHKQAGVPFEAMTYDEYQTQLQHYERVVIGYPINSQAQQPNVDNGVYESLVSLSRLLNAPDEREPIWNALGQTSNVFTLKQTREGAQKLGLHLVQKKLTLAQLQALHSPAVLQMRGDIIAQNPLNPRPNVAPSTSPLPSNRIVTLAQADIEYSIVQDAGMTRIVKTADLAKLYSGEALLPQAATAPSPLKIDNAVRVVAFKSKSDESVQTVKLINEGKAPLALEIERPIPGVAKAELSSKTLAPNESATLTLTIKWREVLPGDVQQVFVTLKTNDAIQPRAMMGFRLEVPAAPPLNVSPAPDAAPPVLP